MLITWTQPRLRGEKSQEDAEEDSSGSSTPRMQGIGILTSRDTATVAWDSFAFPVGWVGGARLR